MKHLILLLLAAPAWLAGGQTATAQANSANVPLWQHPQAFLSDSLLTHLEPRCKQVIAHLLKTEEDYLQHLEGLLVQKNANITDLLEYVKVSNAKISTQVLLGNIKLSELKIANQNIQNTLREERKKNVWRTIGAGVGGVAIGVIAGILISN